MMLFNPPGLLPSLFVIDQRIDPSCAGSLYFLMMMIRTPRQKHSLSYDFSSVIVKSCFPDSSLTLTIDPTGIMQVEESDWLVEDLEHALATSKSCSEAIDERSTTKKVLEPRVYNICNRFFHMQNVHLWIYIYIYIYTKWCIHNVLESSMLISAEYPWQMCSIISICVPVVCNDMLLFHGHVVMVFFKH